MRRSSETLASKLETTVPVGREVSRAQSVELQGPADTRTCTVCGIEYDYNLEDGTHTIKRVIPIAGEYTSSHGRPLEPQLTRLKGSSSHSDSEREGLRVELNGGRYPFDKSSGLSQKAIIEFVCDRERTGLEGVEGDAREGLNKGADKNTKRVDDDGDGKKEDDGQTQPDSSLTYVSYKTEGEGKNEMGVLRLDWRTKYACEGAKDDPDIQPSPSTSKHWGFFTWLIIM